MGARMKYERILAGDIRPGDRVARTRNEPFATITHVAHGPVAVSLYTDAERTMSYHRNRRPVHARPRKTAKWWREVLDA